MATNANAAGPPLALPAEALSVLIDTLQQRGYEVVAPVLRDSAIVFSPIESIADLARGWTVETAPGSYRLQRRGDAAWFSGPVGPASLKPFFHPSETVLFTADRANGGFKVTRHNGPSPRRAFLGVRPCDLAALALQERVLLGDRYADWVFRRQREGALIIAVNCTEPASTCFCASMNTGPKARAACDIVLTEVLDETRHVFLAEPGSEAGAGVLEALGAERAPAELKKAAAAAVHAAARRMGRQVDTAGLHDALFEAFEHPRWDRVAERCLSCGNCTQSCPTCFCSSVEDGSNVEGTQAWRVRKWDSCFTHSFSYIHGGSVRLSPKSRYRQWLTHKFAAWVDQFGEMGCVGCGRCITWCPVGIDITEELAALRGASAAAPAPEALP